MKTLYFDNSLPRIALQKATSLVSRWASLNPISALQYGEVPVPRLPNSRWLKVKNRACGLCGTDIHFMFMEMDPKVFSAAVPGIERKFLGHELVGEVLDVGADVEGVVPGDRIAMKLDWPSCLQLEIDPPCAPCAAGATMLCENVGRKRLPIRDVGGGFAPYMVMHKTQPFLIPQALSDDAALLLEPMASAMHGVLAAPPPKGSKVLVVGAGTIGLLTVAALRYRYPEANIFCLARHSFQGEVARELGAVVLEGRSGTYEAMATASGGRYIRGSLGNEILLGGFDVVYDTVGNDQTLHNSLRWTRSGGTVALIGINFKPGKVDYSPVWAQEVTLKGINCHGAEADGRHSFEHAAQALLDGAVDPARIITHRFPVSRWKDGAKAFLNKKESHAIKIVLEHPH